MAESGRALPLRALALSILALVVPIGAAASGLFEDSSQLGFLTWVLALVPGFLLAYYKGWKGSAVALAGGMAAIAISQIMFAWRGAGEPPVEVILPLVAGFTVSAVGAGWLVEAVVSRESGAGILMDPTTGLRTRVHMNIVVETAVSAAAAGDGVVSAALVEFPQLDRLDARHGKPAAQAVVSAMAEVCRAALDDGAVAGLWGPGRFLLVFPQSGVDHAQNIARRIETDFAGVDLRWQPVSVRTRCTEVRGTGATRAELFADLEADAETGPRIMPSAVVFAPADESRTLARRALELHGLHVAEFEHLGDLADETSRLADAEVVVGEIGQIEVAAASLATLARTLPKATIRILFVANIDAPVVSSDPNTHVLPGHVAPDKIVSTVSGGVKLTEGTTEPASPQPDMVRAATRAEALLARIVIVDDEASARRALVRSLGEIGFTEIEAFDSGASAIEHLSSDLPELLILDLDMPQVDGFDVLEAVRQILDEEEYFPILVVTGNDQWELRQRALRLGAQDFLSKPFDIAELGARAINLVQSRLLHAQMRDTNHLLERRVEKRTADLVHAQNEILIRLAQAVEYRDDITGRHAQRVGELAEAIGRAYGLSREERNLIMKAAPLHDIGKIAIPDAVLLKPGSLTDEERRMMEAHTTIGAKILSNATSPAMEYARSIALTHHEQWDGTGYPRRVAGSEIPIEGRIVAVADVIDVLTHARPYKGPLTFQVAMERVISSRGSHFDPDVVDAAIRAESRLREILGITGDALAAD